MSWTKLQLVTGAFDELSLGVEFDIDPSEQQTMLRRLDAMMATWEARGVRVGYAFPSEPDASDLNTDSGLPDSAAETAMLNLAIRCAPSYGKAVSPDTRRVAREGFDLLLIATAQPQSQQLASMPRGAGNRASQGMRGPFFPAPDRSPLQVIGGDIHILPD